MKSFMRVAAAVIVCSFAGGAAAQDAVPSTPLAAASSSPKNTLTINPLPLVLGMVALEYERATSENLSLYVAPSYWSLSFGSGDDEFGFASYGLGIGARYFMSGVAPEGFWVAPGIDIGFASAEWRGVEGSGVGFGIGAQLGYTWILGDVFDISLGLGAQYASNEVEVEVDEAGIKETQTNGYSGVSPTLRFAIGAAF